MHANIYFVNMCVCIKQKHDFCIFEILDYMQLKHLILFVFFFIILNIKKHVRKYKYTHPSFLLNLSTLIQLQIYT